MVADVVKAEKCFGVKRVARALGVDRGTIRRWWEEKRFFARAWRTPGGHLRIPAGDLAAAQRDLGMQHLQQLPQDSTRDRGEG